MTAADRAFAHGKAPFDGMLLSAVLVALLLQNSAENADYREGVALFEQGRLDASIERLNRAVLAEPRSAQYWKALGAAQARARQYDAASVSFAKACDLNPRLEDACYYLARAEYAANRFESSLSALKRAIPIERQPWRIYAAQGQALEALGRAEEAESALRNAVADCRGRSDSPGLALGKFLFRQGRAGEALVPLRAVLERFPESAEANLESGRVLYQLDRLQEALPLLEKAARLDPASTSAHVLLGKAYARLGREADAQREAELAAGSARQP